VGDLGGDDAIPDWYPLIRAARDAGMPPWELVEQSWWRDHDLLAAARYLNVPAHDLATQPTWWRNIARIAERAEREATEAIQDHASQQQRQPTPEPPAHV